MAFNMNSTVGGLTSISFGIPAAQPLLLEGTLTLPTITTGAVANSQVVVTITQTPNGGSPATIYTGQPGARGFETMASCAALDVITVTISSSAAVDQQLNAVKATISVG